MISLHVCSEGSITIVCVGRLSLETSPHPWSRDTLDMLAPYPDSGQMWRCVIHVVYSKCLRLIVMIHSWWNKLNGDFSAVGLNVLLADSIKWKERNTLRHNPANLNSECFTMTTLLCIPATLLSNGFCLTFHSTGCVGDQWALRYFSTLCFFSAQSDQQDFQMLYRQNFHNSIFRLKVLVKPSQLLVGICWPQSASYHQEFSAEEKQAW